MGGTPSKNRGRGDAPDLFERGSNSDTAIRRSPRTSNIGFGGDRKSHTRWEPLVEGSASTPSFKNPKLSSTDVTKDSGAAGATIVVPSNRGDEPTVTSTVDGPGGNDSVSNLLPPEIQLQVLSPVHSRQQIRDQSKYQRKPFIGLRVPTTSTVDKLPSGRPSDTGSSGSGRAGEPKILFLKQPVKEFRNNDGGGSEQEIQTPRGSRTYLQQQQMLQQRMQHLKQQEQQQQKTKNSTKPAKKNRMEQPSPIPPPTVTISSSSPAPPSTTSRTGQSSSHTGVETGLDTRPGTHTVKKSPPKYGVILQQQQREQTPPAPADIIVDSKPSPPRELTAVSTASSKKLKVKGLKNFVDTHKPCPPLWAKQFPCRSRYHPDNYLYDFEGFNAPKRPVATMDKCAKKCGRCNRCGIYVDNVCTKCGNCSMDCKCPKAADAFVPSPEHFLQQLFGPGWSQSTRVEVNGQPVTVPDKPRLNLHAASSNNPLKPKRSSEGSKAQQEDKPHVLPTGYDSYTPVPDTTAAPPGYPSYSAYPYMYPPAGYAPWPSYYPSYPLPPPVPVAPYYGYAVPPPGPAPPPPYSYPAR